MLMTVACPGVYPSASIQTTSGAAHMLCEHNARVAAHAGLRSLEGAWTTLHTLLRLVRTACPLFL